VREIRLNLLASKKVKVGEMVEGAKSNYSSKVAYIDFTE
jgi:hypothetical protein